MKNIFTLFLSVLFGVTCSAASPDVGLRPATSWIGTNIMTATSAAQARAALGLDTANSVTFSGVTVGDTNVISAISGKQATNVVADLTALQTYSGAEDTVIVTDLATGGTFTRTSGFAVDGVIVVTNTVSDDVFHRQFTGWANAAWWGCVGDWNGSTGTDNAVTLQSAIDWCAANGVTLYLPQGWYYTSKSLDCTDHDKLNIIGKGPHNLWGSPAPSTDAACSVIVGGEVGKPILDIIGSSHVILERFGVQTVDAALPTAGVLIGRDAAETGGSSSRFYDLTIRGKYSIAAFATVAIELSSWRNVRTYNYYTNAACSSMYFGMNSNTLWGVHASASAAGIATSGGGGHGVDEITDCTFALMNAGQGSAFVIEHVQNLTVDSLYLYTSNASNQIHFATSNSRGVAFRGLHCERAVNYPTGLYIDTDISGLTFDTGLLYPVVATTGSTITQLNMQGVIPCGELDGQTWFEVDELLDSSISIDDDADALATAATTENVIVVNTKLHRTRFLGIERGNLYIPGDIEETYVNGLAVRTMPMRGYAGLDASSGGGTGAAFTGAYHSGLTTPGTNNYTMLVSFLCPAPTASSQVICSSGSMPGANANGGYVRISPTTGDISVLDSWYDSPKTDSVMHTVSGFAEYYAGKWVTVGITRKYNDYFKILVDGQPRKYTSVTNSWDPATEPEPDSSVLGKTNVTFFSVGGAGTGYGHNYAFKGIIGKTLYAHDYMTTDEVVEWMNTGQTNNVDGIQVYCDYTQHPNTTISHNLRGEKDGVIVSPAVIVGQTATGNLLLSQSPSAPTVGTDQASLYTADDVSGTAGTTRLYTETEDGKSGPVDFGWRSPVTAQRTSLAGATKIVDESGGAIGNFDTGWTVGASWTTNSSAVVNATGATNSLSHTTVTPLVGPPRFVTMTLVSGGAWTIDAGASLTVIIGGNVMRTFTNGDAPSGTMTISGMVDGSTDEVVFTVYAPTATTVSGSFDNFSIVVLAAGDFLHRHAYPAAALVKATSATAPAPYFEFSAAGTHAANGNAKDKVIALVNTTVTSAPAILATIPSTDNNGSWRLKGKVYAAYGGGASDYDNFMLELDYVDGSGTYTKSLHSTDLTGDVFAWNAAGYFLIGANADTADGDVTINTSSVEYKP